jgi:general secretion pathway protein G
MHRTIRSKTRFAQSGFSLIEIIIVITLIGLIVGWAATQLFGKQDQALWRAGKAQLTQLGGELDRYKLDTGRYPTTQEGLQALVKQPGGTVNWIGPYTKAENIKDPWKNDIVYRSPGSDGRPYELVSYGADGKEGGEGVPNKDIKSWEN